MGSGDLTHNLIGLSRYVDDDLPPEWVIQFSDWIKERVADKDVESLLNYRAMAPFAKQNHPTEEHLLPFFVAMGAGGISVKGRRTHSSMTYGTVIMDMYAFNAK